MKELTVEITNESGLHARPATAFTQLAARRRIHERKAMDT